MNPAVSIIIPTANRPHYLPRAIDSALAGMNPGEVEVIVVPNGPDESWRQSLLPYKNNSSVQVVPVKEANANIARNEGLAKAKGEFIRFLDDDDYLIPEGAKRQYELIQTSGKDVISGSVQLIDEKGLSFDVWHQPDVEDLCAAVLGTKRNCLTTAHLYKRSRVMKAQWNPKTVVRQDLEWLFDLCAAEELSWIKMDEIVGVWQHHKGRRISSSTDFNSIRKMTVPILLRTYERLLEEGRLSKARRQSVTQGLWGCIHTAFFLEPWYWVKIAYIAQKIDPTVRPTHAIYNFPITCKLNPLVIQWIMMPKRWLFHYGRQLLNRL